MKKTMLSAAILLSLAGASMSANAAEIQFTGKISAQTCKLSAGDLKMELPTVGISDVADWATQRCYHRFCAGDSVRGD